MICSLHWQFVYLSDHHLEAELQLRVTSQRPHMLEIDDKLLFQQLSVATNSVDMSPQAPHRSQRQVEWQDGKLTCLTLKGQERNLPR